MKEREEKILSFEELDVQNAKTLSPENLKELEELSQEEYEAFEKFFKAYVPNEDLKHYK